MSNAVDIKKIVDAFGFTGNFIKSSSIDEGHINNTFVFTFDENGSEKKYLVQQLNTFVFKEPEKLMENIVGVTGHISKKVKEQGGDPLRESLTFRFAVDGKPYYIDDEGRFWRCCNFIENAHTYQSVKNASDFEKAARAFGKFQSQLSDYPIDTLHETIINFHNTVSRFGDFRKAVNDNISGRKDCAEKEIEFFLAREKDCSVVTDLIAKGEIPLRVTHNDTKLNNVMFDNDTDEGLCVVDLDTVMPGSSLYDFGDSIRSGATTAAEDEKDLDKVHFSLEYFDAFVKGWLECAGDKFTEGEIEYLPFASKLLTLECGMRFLGDYLNGDVYFKTEYPEHNLVRARTQIKLVYEMEQQMDEMKSVVAKYRRDLGL